MEPGKKKKLKIGCLTVAVLAVLGFCWFYGPLLLALYNKGFLDSLVRHDDTTKYIGTSTDNLKFLRTALMGYQESEGQFPQASGWMEAIQNRLGTDKLKKGEGMKKLVAPEFLGQDGKYGYALNDAVAGKYDGDLKDRNTLMIFESTTTERNAHGDPAKLRKAGGIAITLDGQIVK
jgi:hypothetical protein